MFSPGDRVKSRVNFPWPQTTKVGDSGEVLMALGNDMFLVQFKSSAHQVQMSGLDLDPEVA